MSDLEWVDTEISPVGLNEMVDKRMMPPGQLFTARNVEFSTETVSVRKRTGVAATIQPDVDGLPNADRLVRFKDQLLMLNYNGFLTVLPKAYMPNQGNKAWNKIEEIPVPIVERTPLSADLGGYVLSDMAIVQNTNGDYLNVYGLANYTSGSDDTIFGAVSVKVIEQKSGSVIFDTVLKTANASAPFIPAWIRVAASGDKVLIAIQSENIIPGPAGNHSLNPVIIGWVINCEGAVPVAGPKHTLAIDNTTNGLFEGHDPKCDLTGLAVSGGNPRWALVYSLANSSLPAPFNVPAVGIVQLTGTFLGLGAWSVTSTWNTQIGTWPAAISTISQTANGVEEIWINWVDNCPPYDPDAPRVNNADAWVYAVLRASDGATILGQTTWDTDTGFPNPVVPAQAYWVSAICPTSTAGVAVLMKSQLEGSNVNAIHRTFSWRRADAAGVFHDMMSHRGGDIISKPWKDPVNLGWYYVWVATTYQKRSATLVSPVTYALMHFPESLSAVSSPLSVAVNAKIMLAASTLAERGVCIDYGLTIPGIMSPSPYHPANPPITSSAWDGTDWHSVLPAQYIAGEDTSGPHDVAVFTEHLGRGSSVEFGGATYIAGGTPMMWDGQRLSEVGFLMPPYMYTVGAPVAGTAQWGNTGTLQYCAVFETVNAAGERTLSGVSNVVTATVADKAHDNFWISVDHNLITRRYWTPEYDQVMPHVIVTVYRTAEVNDTIFKRIYQFDSKKMEGFISNPDSTLPITFLDTGSGDLSPSDVAGHETLYGGDPTQSEGELTNDHIVGGCTCLCVHKDRLWVGGCDDPEIIWYSKERADDRTAEFSIGQQIRLPGRRVVALGSLGDALIVFCERGIFAIFGEGPNAQGNPQSGQFSEPVNISATQGCTSPRSVVQFPEGLLFHNELGIHLLDRKHNISFFGQYVWRTTEQYPVVRFVKMVENTKQVRFGLSTADGTDGTVLVYDWAIEVWTEWKHTCTNYWVDAEGWDVHNFNYLTPNGYLFTENDSLWTDGNQPYYELLETGWLNFGRVQGYKRIHRIGLLMERLGAHGLDVEIAIGYDENHVATRHWTSAELTSIGVVDWLRIKIAKKTPAIKIKLTETDSTGPGFSLQSLAFELGMVPGMNRLPAVQSR